MRTVSILFLLGLALLCACRSPGPKFDPRTAGGQPQNLTNLAVMTNQVSADWLKPRTNAFTVGPGDLLEIEMIGDPTTRTTTLVGPDGRIYFYLLPGLEVWGLTLTQTKDLLETELRKLIRNGARVAVSLHTVESKRVWLLGRLNRPGVYPMAGSMTLLEAISLANGPTTPSAVASLGAGATINVSAGTEEVADLERSFVIRRGQVLPVNLARLLREGDMSQNIYLEPDDFIYLPSAVAREVYVLGAVGLPHAVAYAEGMTLISAIATAGGTIKDAYLTHVAVVRGSFSEPQIAVVDYWDIVHGKATDVFIQPHDIVYVPFSPYRVLSRYLDLVLTTFARTVGANVGAQAADPNALPVSPNVPISGAIR